jgi:hypothetical protein
MDMYTVYERGANRVWEFIFEEFCEVSYELLGPESYDSDYKKQLKNDGFWDEEVARWTPPSEERAVYLDGKYDGLELAMKICMKVAKETARY